MPYRNLHGNFDGNERKKQFKIQQEREKGVTQNPVREREREFEQPMRNGQKKRKRTRRKGGWARHTEREEGGKAIEKEEEGRKEGRKGEIESVHVCVCVRESALHSSVYGAEEKTRTVGSSPSLCAFIVCERGGQSPSLALCACVCVCVCVRGVFERGKSRCSKGKPYSPFIWEFSAETKLLQKETEHQVQPLESVSSPCDDDASETRCVVPARYPLVCFRRIA